MAKRDETISREDAELMIRDWQSECVNQPALHNQANVLLSRLNLIRPTIHHRAADKIRLEQQSFQVGDDARFADGYSEGLAFALDALGGKRASDDDADLLDALRKMHRAGQKQGWENAYEYEMKLAEAAIAKAEGRS